MRNLVYKELKLFALPLTYLFILFSFMTMLPGYPILLGAFFVCLGIFQSFQSGGETNDILYSALLPVKKTDVVKAKFIFVLIIEAASFVIMSLLTAVRMTVLSDVAAYKTNALMNASPLFLGFVLIIFAGFNFFFAGGFFKTAYKIAKPFISFIIFTFFAVFIGESLHFFPGLDYLNNPKGEKLLLQFSALSVCALLFAVITFISVKLSEKRFERIDL